MWNLRYRYCIKGWRTSFPFVLIGYKTRDHAQSTFFWATHSSRRMAATVWYDAKLVAFLSTSVDPTGPAIALRWLKGMREEIPTTPQQMEYQTNMHKVDLLDQMRTNYSTQLVINRWWHRYLMFVLDLVLHNSWVCYRHDCKARGERKVEWLRFVYEVAFGLITTKLQQPQATCP